MGVLVTNVSTRIKLGFFLLVVGFALAAGASLWADMSYSRETLALAIVGAVCLLIAITAAGVALFLEEFRGHVVPTVLAGIFGLLGCVFFIAAAALKIDRHKKLFRRDRHGNLDPWYSSSAYDYPCALMILGAIFALIGAIFCLFNLTRGRRTGESDGTREVKVRRGKDTDGDGRVDRVETKTYTVNE